MHAIAAPARVWVPSRGCCIAVRVQALGRPGLMSTQCRAHGWRNLAKNCAARCGQKYQPLRAQKRALQAPPGTGGTRRPAPALTPPGWRRRRRRLV